MVAGRHNLTRRALLGAGVGALPGRVFVRVPIAEPQPARGSAEANRGHVQVHVPSACPERSRRAWTRTLAAYRRAEARVAAFKADEALLPPARRAYPACEDLEERFGALDSRRLNILRRLLRLPAPDLPALALKLDLAVADLAWELSGCETCLETLAADARRLADAA